MHRRTLFHFLTGIDPAVKFPRKKPLSPDSINHFYLQEGHMIEYYKIGPVEKRVVAFFWQAKEYVIPSNGYFSILEPLDETVKMTMSYGSILWALRRYPLFAECYRITKRKYREKVKARLNMLSGMGPKERLAKLAEEQPWVFDLVAEEDIANYLRLNVGVFRRLMGV